MVEITDHRIAEMTDLVWDQSGIDTVSQRNPRVGGESALEERRRS